MKFSLRALAQLAVLCLLGGVLWRVEVEYHGWEGLIWLSYFHWAIPVGVAAFVCWIAFSALAPAGARRVLFILVAAAYAAWSLPLLAMTLNIAFTIGPEWVLLVGVSPWGDYLRPALYAIVAIPAGAFLLARLLGARLPWRMLPVSVVLAALAGPAAIAALAIIDPNHADDIHAVKTGAAVPFVLFALGIPWTVRAGGRALRDDPSAADRPGAQPTA